jgi:hypothetical protein
LRYQKSSKVSGPAQQRSFAEQLAQDVARRNTPAPASPTAPASPAAPAMASAAPVRRVGAVNDLARDIAEAGTGPQRQAFGGGVPDIPEQRPDLTPPPDRRPSLPPSRPPPGSLQDPRNKPAGPPYQTVTLEAAPGAIDAAYGKPPQTAVNLEVAEGVDLGKIADTFAGMKDANKPFDEEEAISQAIRDLLGEQPDVAAERKAMLGEMRSQGARDIQSVRARTGLGGMGLTGAAGALESQVRQETAREQALTTADFDRQARSEALDRLLKGVDLRRSEQVFEKAMDLFGKEEGAAIPKLDANDDGTITDEERAAHAAAVAAAAEVAGAESSAAGEAQDAARTAELEGMNANQFDTTVNEKELKRLGWTISEMQTGEDGRFYFEWTSPNGVVKRAVVDDAFEFGSGGLEWA